MNYFFIVFCYCTYLGIKIYLINYKLKRLSDLLFEHVELVVSHVDLIDKKFTLIDNRIDRIEREKIMENNNCPCIDCQNPLFDFTYNPIEDEHLMKLNSKKCCKCIILHYYSDKLKLSSEEKENLILRLIYEWFVRKDSDEASPEDLLEVKEKHISLYNSIIAQIYEKKSSYI